MKIKALRLYQKLILILLIVITPICIISIYSNHLQQEASVSEIKEAQIAKLSFYGVSISQEIERLQRNTYSCVNDDDFVLLSVFWDMLTDWERTETVINAREKLLMLRDMSPYIANVGIYMPLVNRKISAIGCDYEIAEGKMQALQNPEFRSGMLTIHDDRMYVCSVYPSGQQLKLNPSMLMAIEIERQSIEDILAAIVTVDGGGAFILGGNWQLPSDRKNDAELQAIYQTLLKEDSSKSSRDKQLYQGQECILCWEYCPSISAYIVSLFPRDIALAPLQQASKLIFLLLGIAAVMVFVAAVLEYRVIHLPMKRLVYAFEAVRNENYGIRLETRTKDEFAYLYSSFNHMMVKIQELFDQVYKQKILTQQAQIKQLQSQINPHFFYNSFFIAKGMLDMEEYDAAAHMLATLGRYFQFITRSGSETITLEREVSHAYTYCEVQRIRFRNIVVQFDDFPEQVMGMTVPRLILQPLIENAYVHGLENKLEGMLHVYTEMTPPHLLIHVENTGDPITDDELRTLQDKLDASREDTLEVTGLVNIHRRLRLYYGSDCGLQISKPDAETTRTTLILRLEGKQHV